MSLLPAVAAGITYVRVERPKVDLVHLVLGAFSLTAVLAGCALVIGIAFGVTLILKRRREQPYQPGLDLGQRVD
jgi:hypothetical protein